MNSDYRKLQIDFKFYIGFQPAKVPPFSLPPLRKFKTINMTISMVVPKKIYAFDFTDA